MGFVKKTWLPRLGTGLNKFSNAGTAENLILTNTPDEITQQGDAFTAENMNQLEERIYNAFVSGSGQNFLVNGDFCVFQRGTGGTMTAAESGYCADKWYLGPGTGQSYTWAKDGGLSLTFDFGDTMAHLRQKIEPRVLACLSARQVCVSMEANKKDSVQVSVNGQPMVFDNGYGAVVFSAFTAADGCLDISFDVSEPQNPETPMKPNIKISYIKMELGDAPTPFFPKPIREEIQDCQRFFCKSFPIDVAPANGNSVIMYQGALDIVNNCKLTVRFPVSMAAVPVMRRYGNDDGFWICQYPDPTSTVASGGKEVMELNGNSIIAFKEPNTDGFFVATVSSAEHYYSVAGNWTAEVDEFAISALYGEGGTR